MRWLLAPLLAVALPALAEQTSGGVNFLDSLGYTKPVFYPITVPTEASVSNKWYVDLSSGSGTACTMGSPCSWSSVQGKAGVGTGGPAYIYIRGTGGLSDSGASVIGSSGNEVVIKPWDNSTTATITGRNNWDANLQWVIFDGGPNMQIRFSNGGSGQFDPSLYLHSNASNQHNVKFYRVRWAVTNAGMWISSWGNFVNFYWINNEFHALGATVSGQQHHMYLSGGDSSVPAHTMDGVYILNNIFRDTPGEAIELRMARSGNVLTNLIVDGNAAHDIGKGTCGTGWGCRSFITFSNEGGGALTAPLRVSNNLIWDTGENCLRTWDNPSGTLIYNNTCYNWGSGPSGNGAYCSAAFTNFSFNGASGTFTNNIIYATGNEPNGNTRVPFPPSSSTSGKSFNACRTTVCGTSSQVNLSASSFQSLDENNSNFLKIASGSTPQNNATNLLSTITTDYFGGTRSTAAPPMDIGAQEFGATGGGSAPAAPANFRRTAEWLMDLLFPPAWGM